MYIYRIFFFLFTPRDPRFVNHCHREFSDILFSCVYYFKFVLNVILYSGFLNPEYFKSTFINQLQILFYIIVKAPVLDR